MEFTKKQIQKRVLQNGKPLALSKFNWNGKTRTFSSSENNLVLDFNDINNCTFNTDSNCTFKTRSNCTFKTGSNCTFKTGPSCTFDTGSNCTFDTGSNCVVVRRDIFEVIILNENTIYKIAPYSIKGYLKDGIYSETGKKSIIIDGILSEIISEKGNIFKVKNLGETTISYIIKDGDVYSHGKTIKEARESLIYKISNRDTSIYNNWTLNTEISLEEAIKSYRVITGACESGTRYFCQSKELPKKLTVKEAIELTEGQYNSEIYKSFFNKNNLK